MNDEWELLPCPFCGSANIFLYEKAGITTTFFTECQVCFSQSGDYGLAELAIKAWNTRPTSAGQGVTDEMVDIARKAQTRYWNNCNYENIAGNSEDAMRAALESVALPARVPDGWQLVPIELTRAMESAAKYAGGIHNVKRSWSALLSAAPSPRAKKS